MRAPLWFASIFIVLHFESGFVYEHYLLEKSLVQQIWRRYHKECVPNLAYFHLLYMDLMGGVLACDLNHLSIGSIG
jgi:hypothetical protein